MHELIAIHSGSTPTGIESNQRQNCAVSRAMLLAPIITRPSSDTAGVAVRAVLAAEIVLLCGLPLVDAAAGGTNRLWIGTTAMAARIITVIAMIRKNRFFKIIFFPPVYF
jgi:hypothetical protein